MNIYMALAGPIIDFHIWAWPYVEIKLRPIRGKNDVTSLLYLLLPIPVESNFKNIFSYIKTFCIDSCSSLTITI